MSTPTILVPKHDRLGHGFSSAERRAALEAKGRPWNRPAGGWVSDLANKKQFIILCPFCVGKFNPRQNHYEVWRQRLWCVGKCDGCNQVSQQARGFIHQSTHDQVGEWTRPRRGRWRTN